MGKKKTYKIGETVIDVPEENVAKLLEKYPNSIEMASYIVGSCTIDAPMSNEHLLLQKYPNAKPTYGDDIAVLPDTKQPITEKPMSKGMDQMLTSKADAIIANRKSKINAPSAQPSPIEKPLVTQPIEYIEPDVTIEDDLDIKIKPKPQDITATHPVIEKPMSKDMDQMLTSKADAIIDSRKQAEYKPEGVTKIKSKNNKIERDNYLYALNTPTAKDFRDSIDGHEYVYGAKGKNKKMDCSGAVCKVLNKEGFDLDILYTGAAKLHDLGKETRKGIDDAKDGDIITFKTEGVKVDHVGFIVEDKGIKYIAEIASMYGKPTIIKYSERIAELKKAFPDIKTKIHKKLKK